MHNQILTNGFKLTNTASLRELNQSVDRHGYVPSKYIASAFSVFRFQEKSFFVYILPVCLTVKPKLQTPKVFRLFSIQMTQN